MYSIKWIAPGEPIDDALSVRIRVFVEEQGFLNELDEIDPIAHHVVAYDQAGEPAACGRVFPDEAHPDTYIIGRVAVQRSLREGGAGRRIMGLLEARAAQLGARKITLSAQVQAAPFYERLGYRRFGSVYPDEHCPHIGMTKDLDPPGTSGK